MFIEEKENKLKKDLREPFDGQIREVTKFAFIPVKGGCKKTHKRGYIWLERYIKKEYYSYGIWESASIRFKYSTYE
jgi:hypothetical protein